MKKTALTFLLFTSLIGYGQAPTQGLVAHFDFDGLNHLVNSVNNNQNLTLRSTAPIDAKDRFGVSGKAKKIEAGNGYFLNNPTALPATNLSRSISVWVKQDQAGPDRYIFAYGPFPAALRNTYYGLTQSATTFNNFGLNNHHVVNFANDFEWHNIILTYDGLTTFIYLDGTSLGARLNNIGFNTLASSLRVGYGPNAGNDSYCTIDDLRFYDRVLTGTEISNIVNENKTANNSHYSFTNSKPNGTGTFINIPAMNLNSNTVSIEAKVKIIAANFFSGIIVCRAGNTVAGLLISNVTDNTFKITYMWNALGWDWTGGPDLQLNKKYNLALVIEPTKATIYVDGVPYVHQMPQAIEEFNGMTSLAYDPRYPVERSVSLQIDDLSIWNKSRTLSEIQTGMTCNPNVQDANLVAFYDFNQATNNRTSIIDAKGNFSIAISEQAQKDAFKINFETTQTCSITNIVEEETYSNRANAYPNPVKDILHVSGKVEIFNIMGTKIAEGENEINVENLPSGIYVVKANGKSQKIVKE